MFSKFTVTFGARYEAFTPPTEINGHIANLAVSPDFSTVQCVTPVATGNCVQGSSASLFNGHYNNWAPRIGIAWQPPGKWFSGTHQMTVRAGYSMFYVESYLNTLSSEMANQPPFATANTLTTQTVATPPAEFPDELVDSAAQHADQHRRRGSELPGSLCDDLESVDGIQSGAQHIHGSDVHGNARRSPGRACSDSASTNLNPRTPRGSPMTQPGAFSNFNALQVAPAKAHDPWPDVHGALHVLEIARRCQHHRRRRANRDSEQRGSAAATTGYRRST